MRNLPIMIAICYILHSFCEDKKGARLGEDLEIDGRILLFRKFTNSPPREQYMPLLRISYAAFFPMKRKKYIDTIIVKRAHAH